MARETGITHLTCDRCGMEEYLESDSVQLRQWYDIKRVLASQATTANTTTYTLCSTCYAAFLTKGAALDDEFNTWMSEGKEQA